RPADLRVRLPERTHEQHRRWGPACERRFAAGRVMNLRVSVMLATVLMSAGCTATLGAHNVVTEVDRARRAVMLAGPVVKLAVANPSVKVAELVADDQYQRGVVQADLLSDRTPQASAAEARTRIGTALQTMRDGGWKVIYSACVPPNTSLNQGGTPQFTAEA